MNIFEITEEKQLSSNVKQLYIYAPRVAAKAKAGQFVIVRTDISGERIPLTIAGYNRQCGTVRIIFQTVGATTARLAAMKKGDSLADFTGPLGNPSQLDGLHDVIVVGGGVGCAIALPIADELKTLGARVRVITGFRNKDAVILESELRAASDEFCMTTDDGSYGEKGVVTSPLSRMLESDPCECVYAIGPIPMMKFSALCAKEHGVRSVVSMNPIMIDGTGMCGGCRLIVNGKMSFACVDGPEYDGAAVDFDSLTERNRMYGDFERTAYEKECNLLKKGENNQ